MNTLSPDSTLKRRFELHSKIIDASEAGNTSESLAMLEKAAQELKNDGNGRQQFGLFSNNEKIPYAFLDKEILLFKCYVFMLEKMLSDNAVEEQYRVKIQETIQMLQDDVLKLDLTGSNLQTSIQAYKIKGASKSTFASRYHNRRGATCQRTIGFGPRVDYS